MPHSSYYNKFIINPENDYTSSCIPRAFHYRISEHIMNFVGSCKRTATSNHIRQLPEFTFIRKNGSVALRPHGGAVANWKRVQQCVAETVAHNSGQTGKKNNINHHAALWHDCHLFQGIATAVTPSHLCCVFINLLHCFLPLNNFLPLLSFLSSFLTLFLFYTPARRLVPMSV